MSKVKPEKIAGIVALSYLVLIPAGAIFAWQRLDQMKRDVDDIWTRVQKADPSGSWAVQDDAAPMTALERLRNTATKVNLGGNER